MKTIICKCFQKNANTFIIHNVPDDLEILTDDSYEKSFNKHIEKFH